MAVQNLIVKDGRWSGFACRTQSDT